VKTFLAVCLGGAAGTGARHLVNLGAARVLGLGFPYGTLAVNVAGSFLLAVLAETALRGAVSPQLRAVLGAGVLGGFTTYSSFNQEVVQGIGRGAWGFAAGYGALTLVGCLAAGLAGTWAARAAFGG
jgi:CrcB protein